MNWNISFISQYFGIIGFDILRLDDTFGLSRTARQRPIRTTDDRDLIHADLDLADSIDSTRDLVVRFNRPDAGWRAGKNQIAAT